jgi:hypothetical protein
MGPWVGATEGDLNTESGAISPDREIMPPEYGSDRRRCQPCSRGTVMDLPWAILGPRRPAGWPTDQPSRRCRSDRNMVLGPRRPASPGVAITRKAGRESVTVRDKGSGNASADIRRYPPICGAMEWRVGASGTARINRSVAAAVSTIRALRPIFVHQTRPAIVGHLAGGYCLASQVAGFSHVLRVAVAAPGPAPGPARARPGSDDPGPGRDSPGDQLNAAANMPGS